MNESSSLSWFGVRTVLKLGDADAYEERITVWRAQSLDDAISRALDESQDYAGDLEMKCLGFAQAYAIAEEEIAAGTEVFSLIRESSLDEMTYLRTFFSTGLEHEQKD